MPGYIDHDTMQDPLTPDSRGAAEPQPQAAPALARAMEPTPGLAAAGNPDPGSATGCGARISDAAAIAFARHDTPVALHYLHGEEADAHEVATLVEHTGRPTLALPGDAPLPGGVAGWPEARPESERYLALLEALGASALERRLALPLQARDHDECAALVAAHGLEPERLVLIHPGAAPASQRWPAERFAAVADNLAADGWQIVIVGSAADLPITSAVLGEMAAPALHLTSLVSPGAMAALVARSRLVVCNDSGIARIAAALRSASVVVTAGSDARRRVPADHPPCLPCLLGDCAHDHGAAHDVSVEQVVGTACAQLARVRGARPAAPNVLHTAAEPVRAAPPWHHAA